jgi:hypothetical protein
MRTHTLLRPLLAAVLMTTAVGVAACGAEPGADDGSTGDRQDDMQEAALKFARCMREHGIDMDDPQPGQRGIRLTQPKGVSPQKMKAADEACRKYLEAVKPPQLSEEEQKEFREAALANAQCMRDHGITNFPDPTFDADGAAGIKLDKKSGLNPDDPKFQAAQKACEKVGGFKSGPSTTTAGGS